MRRFPEPIQNAMVAFSRLPGVGPKTALRYVYELLKRPKEDSLRLAHAIIKLSERILVCPVCFCFSQTTPCEICADSRRDPNMLCVVEESRDISTIESTNMFKGYYHVLGGILNPIDGMTPDTLRIRELEERIALHPEIREIILAVSPTAPGEATMMYLSKRLLPFERKISKLARGLPIGASIEYADEVTLGDALKGRRTM